MLTFPMRLKSANYKSNWNILVFSDQSNITPDLNMSHGKISVLFHYHDFGSLYS